MTVAMKDKMMTQQQQSYNDDQERRRTELHERIAKKRMEDDQVSLTQIEGILYLYSIFTHVLGLFILSLKRGCKFIKRCGVRARATS